MGLLQDCKELFGTEDPFKIFEIKEDSSSKELRTAFFAKSKEFHPDKNAGKNATLKFQVLNRLYSTLSDEEKRKIYLETGELDEENSLSIKTVDNWLSFWNSFFKNVDLNSVEAYKQKYIGSEQEITDIKENYLKFKGDMDKILQNSIFAEVEREDEIRQIIDDLIDSGEVEAYKNYTNEPKVKRLKRQKASSADRKEFETSKRKKVKDDDLSLELAIRSRANQRSMDNFLDSLEEKYSSPKMQKTKCLKANSKNK